MQPLPPPPPPPHTHTHMQEYAAYLRALMKESIAHPDNYDAPLAGFKIVVNPGNGGGAFIADQARQAVWAGCEHLSLYLWPVLSPFL